MAIMLPNKPTQPLKTTDRRRLTKPASIQQFKLTKPTVPGPVKSIFNDRRPPQTPPEIY